MERFGPGQGDPCQATQFWCAVVDDQGNLYKCLEDMDKPEFSFGRAAIWDPKNPFFSADRPDHLTAYLNAAGALNDTECQDCILLPACRGGCPKDRFFYRKEMCAVQG